MKPYKCLLIIFLITVHIIASGQNNLFIPPVLNGPMYNLNMQQGIYQFNPGVNSATKGFNGNILGPTLIMQSGEKVYMNVTNSIGEETTVHWHGFHVASENDGGPHTIIDPNTTWKPNFPVLDKAGTYWYHPHAHELTSKHVLQGLAGMIIVKDAQEATLNIPRTYGVDDFPLIIQTKATTAAGVIEFVGAEPNRDTLLLVNATKNAALNVPAQMVRLRILNASHQRVFNLGLSNNALFYHIATDGGLKNTRTSVSRLRIAPGERAEIVVAFNNYAINANLQLMSYGQELPDGTWGATKAWINNNLPTPGYSGNPMNGANFTVLKFKVVTPTANAIFTVPPSSLANVTPIPENQANTTRQKWLFSGNQNPSQGVRIGSSSNVAAATAFSLAVVNERIPLGNTEIWTIHGAPDQYHPFHIHDIQFYILDRKDSLGNIKPLTSMEIGRKDVVSVGPKETVRFITKFDDFWGDVPYMYHCHITVHEDKGMMKQFEVNSLVYMDRDYLGSPENGTSSAPFKKLSSAAAAAPEGSTILVIRGGLHDEIISSPILIKKKIKIKPFAGTVTIQ